MVKTKNNDEALQACLKTLKSMSIQIFEEIKKNFLFIVLVTSVALGIAQDGVIKEIVVFGNELVDEAIILQELKSTVGEPFSSEMVSEDIKAIYRLGYFRDVQVDVVALNWQEKAILLGECKWGTDTVDRSTLQAWVDRAPLAVPDQDWQVHYVYFARAGSTDAAQSRAEKVDVALVDLERLDADLGLTMGPG